MDLNGKLRKLKFQNESRKLFRLMENFLNTYNQNLN